MRHQRKTVKLGRTQGHRDALLSNLAVSLIEHGRIKTTVAKAKAIRPFVEKLVTKAKTGSLHARRMALADLRHNEDAVTKLFTEIGPINAARKGGYTRIIKLGQRRSDASEMAVIEWVDAPAAAAPAPAKEEKAEKPAKKPAAKKAPAKKKKDEGEA
ncbi:MAG: ribosomal protein [Verrucomicrobiota bacterium]|jgi:large subunit ribosomal protein L17